VRWAASAALALLAVKVGLEALTGRVLAAGPLPPGVVVAPVVHVAGGAAGVLIWWLEGRGGPRR
jgi:hypothetical protein